MVLGIGVGALGGDLANQEPGRLPADHGTGGYEVKADKQNQRLIKPSQEPCAEFGRSCRTICDN